MTWTKAIWGSSFQRRCIQVVITIPQINIDRAISQVFYEFPLKLGYFMLCSMSIWWMDVDGNWSSMFITGYRVHDGLAVCAKILRHKCPERCWNKGSPMHHQFSSGKSWDMLMGQRKSQHMPRVGGLTWAPTGDISHTFSHLDHSWSSEEWDWKLEWNGFWTPKKRS